MARFGRFCAWPDSIPGFSQIGQISKSHLDFCSSHESGGLTLTERPITIFILESLNLACLHSAPWAAFCGQTAHVSSYIRLLLTGGNSSAYRMKTLGAWKYRTWRARPSEIQRREYCVLGVSGERNKAGGVRAAQRHTSAFPGGHRRPLAARRPTVPPSRRGTVAKGTCYVSPF